MPVPKLKILIILVFFLFISLIALTFITLILYDRNSFLNPAENFIEAKLKDFPAVESIIEKNTKKYPKPVQNENYTVIDVDKKIPSTELIDLLYFLKDAGIKYLVIDANYDKLMDYFNDDILKSIFRDNSNFFGVVALSGSKGLDLFSGRFSENKDVYKNLLLMKKEKLPLIFASYLDDLKIINQFEIPPDRLGFVNTGRSFLDENNVDAIYKFDKKFLLNAPFLIYAREKNWEIGKIEYDVLYFSYHFRKLYYDQKGRMCFNYDNKIKYGLSINNYNDFEGGIKARINAVLIMNKLDILKPSSNDFNGYLNEEASIDKIYNVQKFQNEKLNALLQTAKDNATAWKGFKDANAEKLKSGYVFITVNNNYGWVNNYIEQLNIIKYGINYKRIPQILIVALCFILIIILLLLSMAFRNDLVFGIVMFAALNILNVLCYFGLRIFLQVDFSFTVVFFTIIYGIISIIMIKRINLNIWIKEVKNIYKASISEKYNRVIANIWKNNQWSLLEKSYMCSFMQVDTSVLLKTDFNKSTAKFISSKNSEIETVIKNNFGVRNNFSSTRVSCYFGNPKIENTIHADMAIETAVEISKIPLTSSLAKENIRIAIHTKEEWFRYVKKENQRYYTYFGNAIPILESILKYADEFKVSLVITDSTYKLSSQKYKVRMLDRISVKGINQTFRLFELLFDDSKKEDDKFYDYFHAGLKLYENRKWNEAGSYFRQCLKYNGNDAASEIFFKRCRNYAANEPPESWEAVFEIE